MIDFTKTVEPPAAIDFAPPPFENAPTMGRQRDMSIALAVALTLCGGCRSLFARRAPAQAATPNTNDPSAEHRYGPLGSRRSATSDPDVIVVGMIFDVQRIAVPADQIAKHRDDLWKYINELRLDPDTAAHLANNGFRMGVTSRSDLTSIRDLLTPLDTRFESVTQTVQSGHPATLDLGLTGPTRTIYAFHADGRLEGKTFNAATKYLHIDYAVDMIDQQPRTTLRVTPEVFQESERQHWHAGDGEIRYEKQYEGTVYHELAADVPMMDGDVLVIGPTDSQADPYLLGNTLLSSESAGRRWETILCITPRVYRLSTEGK